MKPQYMKHLLLFAIILVSFKKTLTAQSASAPLTALEAIKLIKQHVQPRWFDTRTDTIIIGNGSDTIKGIATCMFVDMNILKQAVAANCNMIITH